MHRVVRERRCPEIRGHTLEGRGGLTAHAIDINGPLGIHRQKQGDRLLRKPQHIELRAHHDLAVGERIEVRRSKVESARGKRPPRTEGGEYRPARWRVDVQARGARLETVDVGEDRVAEGREISVTHARRVGGRVHVALHLLQVDAIGHPCRPGGQLPPRSLAALRRRRRALAAEGAQVGDERVVALLAVAHRDGSRHHQCRWRGQRPIPRELDRHRRIRGAVVAKSVRHLAVRALGLHEHAGGDQCGDRHDGCGGSCRGHLGILRQCVTGRWRPFPLRHACAICSRGVHMLCRPWSSSMRP